MCDVRKANGNWKKNNSQILLYLYGEKEKRIIPKAL